MSKKNLILISIFAIFLLSINGVFAKDVAYVVKNYENANVLLALNDLGYTYDIISDTQVPSVNFSNYAILLVQDSITNKDYLPLTSKNIIFINKDYAPLVWTSGTVIAGSSTIFSAKLDQLNTVFTNGLTSVTFDAYTTPKPEYYLHVYPSGITSVSRTTGSTGSYPIIAYSNSNNIRKVFFGFYSIDYWSADTKKLFKNALNYTRMGVDNDHDGFYSDSDCNDNDITKWQNIAGYLDSDKDSYGTGSVLQICSGNTLPTGYSNVSTDCNDNDITKYRNLPGYLDSDKDSYGTGSVLQICSGANLPIGYSQVGGDCNDNNSSLFVNLSAYLDLDLDGRGSGDVVKVCTNGTLPIGYSNLANDCNDTDSSVWRLIPGYSDIDNDLFGIGNVTQVCSGFSLLPGYSTNNFDCNDSNNLINPDAVEIPYNGIDETCKGYDTADLDHDGYCKSGYNIINASLQCIKETEVIGTDCNDNSNLYNPDSIDETKDCKNKAPIIENISDIRVRETEKAIITINASDVDKDLLIYSINDSRFVQDTTESNVFYWQTGYLDSGNYIVEVSVSDGITNVTKNVKIDVVSTNRKPECNLIPLINGNEDSIITLNLNDYCSDPDNDSISFSVKSLSSNIKVESINNGIVNLTCAHDYFGTEYALFNVYDGLDNTTANVTFNISPVNDAPVFSGNILDISFNEGSNLTNAIDLKKYFTDVDSDLTFNYTGDYNLELRLHNGWVSFYPKNGFTGTEAITFSASDNEFTITSNPVNILVNDINQAPIFGELGCVLNINEDSSYECNLEATDPENDSFAFFVLSSSRVNCTIEGNVLKYISLKDQSGQGSCTIRVTDSRNATSDKSLVFNMDNINDAPVINDYYPKESSIKLLANVEKRFVIFASDIDSQTSTTWKINDEIVGNQSGFTFARQKGTYQLTATVSDGEYSITQTWSVIVGDLNDFTCSEVSGHVCNENQTCPGTILGVSDTNSCCSISCTSKPPQFINIKNTTTENKTTEFNIDVDYPETDSKLYIGESYNSSINVKNNFDRKMDVDVYMYIYDTTKERIISKSSQDVEINSDTEKNVLINFNLEEDLDEENNYYIFVRVVGKDSDKNKYYSEMYQKLDIERKDSSLKIQDVAISPIDGLVCGDEVTLKTTVENLGKNVLYVTIRVDNSDLLWSQVSESFRVGSYDDDASEKSMTLKIPNDAKEGTYKVNISFGNQNNNQIFEKEIILGACKNQLNTESEVEIIKINQNNSEAALTTESKNDSVIIAGFLSLIFMIGILVALLYFMKNNNISNERLNEFGIIDVTPIDDNISSQKKTKTSKKRK